jgi:RNA polymerase sigma factor (sigma-70 family)
MDKTDLQQELERLHQASFGWALWCCNHRKEEAVEVLLASYLKVLEGAASFDGRASVRTWFFSVVRRTAWEQRRRRWVRESLLGRWLTDPPVLKPQNAPDEALTYAEESRALREMLAKLPRRQREVLHLVFYQDLTIEDSAGVLNISLGTARTHFQRGKATLRDLLAGTGKR